MYAGGLRLFSRKEEKAPEDGCNTQRTNLYPLASPLTAYRGLLQVAHEGSAVLHTDWSSYAAVVLEALGPVPRAKRRPDDKRRTPTKIRGA
jgi:hypothetical protein